MCEGLGSFPKTHLFVYGSGWVVWVSGNINCRMAGRNANRRIPPNLLLLLACSFFNPHYLWDRYLPWEEVIANISSCTGAETVFGQSSTITSLTQ